MSHFTYLIFTYTYIFLHINLILHFPLLGDRADQGIGTAALKVIAECIHRSRVKDIGLAMLAPKDSEDVQFGFVREVVNRRSKAT